MFDQLTERFESIFRHLRGLGKITDANIQQTARQVRRVLLEGDVNYGVVRDFVQRVQDRAQGTAVLRSIKPGEQFIKLIHDELVQLLGGEPVPLTFASRPPTVFLLAGLQGSGKTSTCAKLGHRLVGAGKSVLLVAADVYRPAAREQLMLLGEQVNIPVYSEETNDPVGICKRALGAAAEQGQAVVILDTAGRLHLNREMMAEIGAIAAAVKPTESLFVVDGMTGQDAVNSAQAFHQELELSGIILTKMDGDSRGGAAVSIAAVTGKPVKFISVSEKVDGLAVFEPRRIADRILGFGDVMGLVEKAQATLDQKTAEQLERKLRRAEFDLEDFGVQLRQVQGMGPLHQLLELLPGANRKMMRDLNLNERQLAWTEAIINSMTPEERRHPRRIDGRRRQRIARGSGRPLQEVNQLLKQFSQMKKLVQRLGRMKVPAILQNRLSAIN